MGFVKLIILLIECIYYSYIIHLAVTQHGGWKTGFNKKSFSLDYHWTATLPDQVDILVTHSPCKGIIQIFKFSLKLLLIFISQPQE